MALKGLLPTPSFHHSAQLNLIFDCCAHGWRFCGGCFSHASRQDGPWTNWAFEGEVLHWFYSTPRIRKNLKRPFTSNHNDMDSHANYLGGRISTTTIWWRMITRTRDSKSWPELRALLHPWYSKHWPRTRHLGYPRNLDFFQTPGLYTLALTVGLLVLVLFLVSHRVGWNPS